MKYNGEYVMAAAVVIKEFYRFIKNEYSKNLTFNPINIGKLDVCIAGWRHACCWEVIRSMTGLIQNDFKFFYKDSVSRAWVDGFLTSENRFLTRKEAFELVKENGQIERIDDEFKKKYRTLRAEIYTENYSLTSEDLW